MRVSMIRQVLPALGLTAMLFGGLPASAASLGLGVYVNGESAGYYGASVLGCTDIAGTPTAVCAGTGPVEIGGPDGLAIDSWNVFVDSDPVINGVIAVTNLGAVTQQYTLIFNLPIAPAIPGATLIGGSVQGGATDNNGNGVTLSTAGPGTALYTARIDGTDVQSLYLHSQSFSTAAPFGSINVPALSFGAPIPSQIGPAALVNIGIRLDFLLTPGDSATFSSNFVVQPVPVPAAVWLFGSALGLMGWMRRKAAA